MACKVHTTSSIKKRENKMACGLHTTSSSSCTSLLPSCTSSPAHSCSYPFIPTILHVIWLSDMASLGLLGTGDVALLGGIIGVIGGQWHGVGWGASSGCWEVLGGGDMALFAAFLMALGASDIASVGSIVGGIWGLWCGVIGCQQDWWAHPRLAQEWAVTRGLNSGGGGCM